MAALQWDPIDNKAVDTARVLAADAVEKVGNGHPGTAMSLAPAAYLLFQKVMRRDPQRPRLARSRPLHPLGGPQLADPVHPALPRRLRPRARRPQGAPHLGLADSRPPRVRPHRRRRDHHRPARPGLSLRRRLRLRRAASSAACSTRRPTAGTSPFDHFVYVIAGDGDLQEGVTSEASSLAGHQQLGNLIAIYDSNQISIEDDTNIAFTEDVKARYEAYHWHVQVVDWKKTGEYVEDVAALNDAIEAAKAVTDKPSLIILKTIIGWPAPEEAEHRQDPRLRPRRRRAARPSRRCSASTPRRPSTSTAEVIEHTRKAVERGAGSSTPSGRSGVRRLGRGQPRAQGSSSTAS